MKRARQAPMPPAGLTAANRNEWMAVWRRVRVQPDVLVDPWCGTGKPVFITTAIKTAGIWAAEFATYETGADIFPGRSKLGRVAGLSEHRAGLALGAVCALGFCWQYVDGSKHGRQGVASEYRLTIPDDVLERIPLLTPDLDVPDYQVTSEHVFSEQVFSRSEQVTSGTGTGDVRAPHPSVPSITTPLIRVSVGDSSVEGSSNGHAPRGLCPECHRSYLLSPGGTLRNHGGCPGAGKLPAAVA